MSENIQSISQGTYTIGQTSASDSSLLVTENSGNVSILQGTVATSAGIVGDGTTQNPLRADETVLWSGSWRPGNGTAVTNSAVEVSESIYNFEYIRVVTEGALCQVITFTPKDCQAFICYPETDTKRNILGLKISNDDSTHIRFKCGYSTNFVDSYRSNQDWGYFTLKKIIGINRKA